MHITLEQLDSFHKYAIEKIANSDKEWSWSELFQHWRRDEPIAAKLDDSAGDLLAEMNRKNGPNDA